MYQVLQVVVAFISFSMSVSLMNIYVAVLVAAGNAAALLTFVLG